MIDITSQLFGIRPLTAVVVLLVASFATGQAPPNVQVTAYTQLGYSAGTQTRTVPQGQNLTSGSGFSIGTAMENASHLVQSGIGGDALAVRIDERIYAYMGASAFGPHQFQVEYRSAAPEPALIEVSGDAWLTFGLGASAQGWMTFTVSGVSTAWNFAPIGGPFAFSQPVVVDTGGVRVRLQSSGAASAGGGAYAQLVSDWTVRLRPNPCVPCTIQTQGTTCGASLSASKTWGSPDSYVLTVDSAPGAAPLLGAFALGTSSVVTPLPGGCVLRNDASFVAVLGVNAAGQVAARLFPPAVPGFRFEAQALLLRSDGTVSSTEDLVFTCN